MKTKTIVPSPLKISSLTSMSWCFFISQSVGSVTQSCLTLCDLMDYSKPGFPLCHQLLKLIQTHVHRAGDAIRHLILCHPLLLLPSIFPSIRMFIILCQFPQENVFLQSVYSYLNLFLVSFLKLYLWIFSSFHLFNSFFFLKRYQLCLCWISFHAFHI